MSFFINCLDEEESKCGGITSHYCKTTSGNNSPVNNPPANVVAFFKPQQQVKEDSVMSMPRISFGTINEESHGPPAISYSDGLGSSTIVKEFYGYPAGREMNISTVQRGCNSSRALGSDQSQILSSNTYTQPSKLSEVL